METLGVLEELPEGLLETEGEGEEDLERTRERVTAPVPVPGGPAEKE